MTTFSALPDPIANIWTNVRIALAYAQANLNVNNLPAARSLAQGVFSTLVNARDALAAAQMTNALNVLYVNLSPVLALSLPLTAAQRTFINNRIQAIQSVAASLVNLVPAFGTPSSLAAGKPTISDVGYLTWQMQFAFETVPQMVSVTDLMTAAQNMASAWRALAPALQNSGEGYAAKTLDLADGMAATSSAAFDDLTNVSSDLLVNVSGAATDVQTGSGGIIVTGSGTPIQVFIPAASLSSIWERMVAWSSIQRLANSLSADPTSPVAQQIAVVRLVVLRAIKQFASLLLALRQAPAQAKIRTVTVRQGDTLMSIASRVLGNFESWYQIAQVNALVPPFIASSPSPGVAAPGSVLYLPTTATLPAPAQAPSYSTNYLGRDIYYGPLNQPMIPWQGDFATISGYSNLSLSLGRRLQTTKGTLIFHPQFGSRIPPEIGHIATPKAVGHIGAFAASALKSDPRVNKVQSLQVTVGENYSIHVSATVIPNGSTGPAIPLNEVLQP